MSGMVKSSKSDADEREGDDGRETTDCVGPGVDGQKKLIVSRVNESDCRMVFSRARNPGDLAS